MADKPLDGILVVSLEQAVAAPFATARLADAGARVIKIERDVGDFARGYDNAVHGMSSFFVWLNRGKESVCLDIKDAADAALLARLVAQADVFVQNLAPGAAARAGFGSDALRARHPRLVTCDISGYGEEGEYRDMKAYDLLVQAESGLASISGSADEPGRAGISICDISCGATAHGGIVEALFARERTGKGRGVMASLFHTMTDYLNAPILAYDFTGKTPPRIGLRHTSIQPYGAFPTGDGSLVLIGIQNEREWAAFCRVVLGDAGLATDARFASNVARVENRPVLEALIGNAFASLTQAQVAERLREANTAFSVVNTVDQVAAHPQLRRTPVATPEGPVDVVAPGIMWKGREPDLGPVPALGEHTEAVRKEFAG
jgi:itaconate CoA-transferase